MYQGPMRKVLTDVCHHYKINPSEMNSARRQRRIAWPRQLIMYICSKKLGASSGEIGALLDRDHSTVLSGIKMVEKRLCFDAEFRSGASGMLILYGLEDKSKSYQHGQILKGLSIVS